MTTQNDLALIWADTGGVTDPGATKYSTGWVAEIPTYQNFNYVLQNNTKNTLSLAESGAWNWESTITYSKGSIVYGTDGKKYISRSNSNVGNDPVADTTQSYWQYDLHFGLNPYQYSGKTGFVRWDDTHVASSWLGQDMTLQNWSNSFIMYAVGNGNNNWLMGNFNGELVCANVGTLVEPDSRAINPTSGNSYRLFHEGHPPEQSEVSGTIPENPQDGLLYGRRDGNWVEVTSVKVQEFPPQPVKGNGNGWYSLADGELFIDINDGDSSQWVPASPPPQIDIEPSINIARAGRRNLIINGDFKIWQRGDNFVSVPSSQYTADMWLIGSSYNCTKGTDGPLGLNYGLFSNNALTAVELLNEGKGGVLGGGRTFTLSFYTDAPTSVGVNINFRDTIGSTTNQVQLISTVVATSGTWDKYEVTFTINDTPNLTNKLLAVIFTNLNNSGLTGVQLEQVDPTYPKATEFEYRSMQEELALCQRYYFKTYNQNVPPGSSDGTGKITAEESSVATAINSIGFKFPVTMRSNAIGTCYSTSGAKDMINVSGTDKAVSSVNVSESGLSIINTVDIFNTLQQYSAQIVVDAGL